jgi:hypothetical protein
MESPVHLAAAEAPPTGGAAFSEILIAAGIAAVFFAATGWVLLRERTGHRTLFGRASEALGRKVGLPVWAVLPALGLFPVWILAGFGVYWDVPIHTQKGRDEGPLANPSHYPIFLVLLFLLCFGLLVMALAKAPLPKRTLALAPSWKVPFSAVILTICGFIAVIGFPADDFWHRIFGQDVTEWGPTHVLMIGGAVCSALALPLLLAEARQVGSTLLGGRAGRWVFGFALSMCMLPMAFLMELELGTPQFPAACIYALYGFLVAWTAIATRIWFGRGGALYAGFWWIFVHLALVAIIAPLPGIMTIRFLLMVPEVVVIELVALAFGIKRGGGKNLVPFAVVASVLAGLIGLPLEFLWSNWWMSLHLNPSSAPLLVIVGTLGMVAGGLLALWHVRRTADVAGDDQLEAVGFTVTPTFRHFGLAGFGLFVLVFGAFYQPAMGEPLSAKVTFDQVTGGQQECPGTEERCEAYVTVEVSDPDRVEDAVWFAGFQWQGWGKDVDADEVPHDPLQDVPGVVRTRMVPTGTPGEYRSEHPLPLYGEGKTMLRYHEAPRTMMAFPLYLPEDPAIGGERGRQVTTTDGEVVEAVFEPELLQRERDEDIPPRVYDAANAAVLFMWFLVVLSFGWCYNRAAGYGGSRRAAGAREKVDA